MQQRAAERSGKGQQVYDERPVNPDSGAGSTQPDSFRSRGGNPVLSGSESGYSTGGWSEKCDYSSHEPVFLYLKPCVAAMEIFGSYMGKEHTLAGEGVRICGLDTFVAIYGGLIIFPACFSYGVEVGAGPSLIFITLPNVFVNMTGGRIWGSLFFLFMTFASFSTVIAVFENIMSFCMDMFGWKRSKAALINCLIILAASMPCVLGYNVWSNLHLIGGRDVLDSEDFIVSNLLLPIGSLIYLLFCVTKWGWGFSNYMEEANTGKGLKIAKWLKPYFQFILPMLILIILIQGLV